MAGFRDEDEDFADLLPPPAMTSSSYAFASENDEEDMSADPWGDTTSSGSALYTPSPFTGAYEPQSPEQQSTSPPATPSFYDEPRGFTRESAPEPETPAYSRTASTSYNYDSYQEEPTSPIAPSSPFQAPYSPPAAAEQTPFGSPNPAYSPTSHTRHASKPDLSALLGEEKPILPKFTRRETPEGVAGPLGSKIAVLPVSSIGKKPVGGALATLLGLEVDEAEAKKEKERLEAALKAKSAGAKAAPPPAPAVKEEPKEEVKEVAPPSAAEEPTPTATPAAESAPPLAESIADSSNTEAPAPEPLPPTPTISEPIPPPVLAALSTPLPPSPSVSPPPPADSSALTPQPPALSRTSSTAGSMLSVDSSQGNGVYDTIVSPMEAEGAAEAWPGEEGKGSVEGLEKKLEALKVDTSSTGDSEEASMDASEPTPTESSGEQLPSSETATLAPTPSTSSPVPPASLPTAVETGPDPFAQYTYSETASPAPSSARPSFSEGPISPTTARGFRSYNGSTDEGVFGGADDADSLRGTYSRSVEVSEGGEDASDAMDAERAGITSPPLPPLPTMGSPSVGTSPRSTEIGGSLGPTFIISVGDPQKIGSSLNVAAQHTVYTVLTRTTSKAFRKNDFSVLRRFSHFLWLFDALTLNNPGVIVPGMPEKNALGRFGADFVENRRSGLQAALMKIVSHPMLVGDPDLRLFLESDTFSIDIKQRKLDTGAESKGLFASLSGAITGPSFVEFDEYFDTRRHILDTFETQLRSLLTSLASASKVRHSLQASISELQSAFLGLAQCDLSPSLRKVLEDAARLQEKLRRLSEEQSASEEIIGGLNSVAEGYARLCASARLVFGARIKAYHVWQSAESALRKTKTAHEKAKKSGRTHSELLGLSVSEIAEDGSLRLTFGNQAERKMLDAKQDFEDVSKLTKAEMARFDKEKVEDFKKAIEDYADGLATRQRAVVAAWQVYHDMLVNVVAANTQPSPTSLPLPTAAEEQQ